MTLSLTQFAVSGHSERGCAAQEPKEAVQLERGKKGLCQAGYERVAGCTLSWIMSRRTSGLISGPAVFLSLVHDNAMIVQLVL
jgi:hypothetical protein